MTRRLLEERTNESLFQENTCGGFCHCDSLTYMAPSTGGFGLYHCLLQVPESHQLFVAPSGCGRHTALATIYDDSKDRVSYYLLSQEEIVDGYDDEMEQAVDDLIAALDRLGRRPKAIITIVSCLDNLIGTDNIKVLEKLGKKYPDIAFQDGHMDPITSDSKTPPLVKAVATCYRFLKEPEDGAKTDDVNLLGQFIPIEEDNEIHHVLRSGRIRQIGKEDKFDEYQSQARSRLNLVMAPTAKFAADELKERLGAPYLVMFTSYSLDNVAKQYDQLEEALEQELNHEVLEEARAQAEEAVDKALEVVGDRPIWIAGGGVTRPYDTAKAFLEYGFNVEAILVQNNPAYDKEAMAWVNEKYPDIRYMQTQHYTRAEGGDLREEAIGIGFDAAYQAGTGMVVPLVNDNNNFGYRGIQSLMEAMVDAVRNPKDLEKMIEESNIVI